MATTEDLQNHVGARIAGVFVDNVNGQSRIALRKADGSAFLWTTEGDCCSESWFADINGADSLRDAVITEIRTVEMGEVDDERTRQDVDRVYGVKITTSKGHCDVVFRNSSNGYYGGWMDASVVDAVPAGFDEINNDDWRA